MYRIIARYRRMYKLAFGLTKIKGNSQGSPFLLLCMYNRPTNDIW